MGFIYFRSWLSRFDPASFRYALRLAKFHDDVQGSGVEFGKALGRVALTKKRDSGPFIAHFEFSSTLARVKLKFADLKPPASQGITEFRESFAQLLRHHETLAGGEWNRLAKTMTEKFEPLTENEVIEVMDAASGALAGLSIGSENFKTASHTFLSVNKRI